MEPISITVLVVIIVLSIIAGVFGGILLIGGIQGTIIGLIICLTGAITLCVIAPKAAENLIETIKLLKR